MTQPLQRLAELPKTGLEQLRFYLMASGPRERRPRSLNGDSVGGWGMWAGLGGIFNLPFSVRVLI